MKIVSIHSHKGGAGKTTIALCLAKAFALENQKVCAVDIDFVGSGFEDLLKIKKAEKTLNNFVLALPGEKVAIQDIISTYTDKELKKQEINLILNTGRNNHGDLKEKAMWYSGREPNMRKIGERLSDLLKKLSAAGYDWCFLDCHPGLYEISLSLLQLFKKEKIFHSSLALFVTTTNKAHLLGLLREMNWFGIEQEKSKRAIDPKHSMLVINRTTKTILLSSIRSAIRETWDITGPTLFSTLNEAGFFLNLQIIQETPELLDYADIISDGILPNIKGEKSFTELKNKIKTVLS